MLRRYSISMIGFSAQLTPAHAKTIVPLPLVAARLRVASLLPSMHTKVYAAMAWIKAQDQISRYSSNSLDAIYIEGLVSLDSVSSI